MARAFVLISVLLAAACGDTTPSLASPSATNTPTATPTPKPMPALTLSVRRLSDVPYGAIASPDGRWIAAIKAPPAGKAPYEPALLIFTADGKRHAEAPVVMFGGWLPDSSGIYAATFIPQRAPPLQLVGLDGGIHDTQIQLNEPLLSNDGKWIVAAQQENCCANIVQREVLVSSRDGGRPRSLYRSATDGQSVTVLGIDDQDGVVLRDGQQIVRVPLDGSGGRAIASSPDLESATAGTSSPDRKALLIRGYQPARWYVLANGTLTPWDDTRGEVVVGDAIIKGAGTAMWVAPHSILARDVNGQLLSYDALLGTPTTLAASITGADRVLAESSGRLLVLRGRRALVVELVTGAVGDTTLDVTDPTGAHGSPLPSAGFLLSSPDGTYRID